MLRLKFQATVIHWRGPSPFFFAPIPAEHVVDVRQAAKLVTYGWGMIPVKAAIGGVAFGTSLFPKDDTYLLPIKAEVRKKRNITVGDTIDVDMTIRPAAR
jgi:Domain of unknown function (DUF1905)